MNEERTTYQAGAETVGDMATGLLSAGRIKLLEQAGLSVVRTADWERERANALAMGAALGKAAHELATLHGLTASDGLREYVAALEDGCDAAGAWSCYVAETWTINLSVILSEIDAALSGEAGLVLLAELGKLRGEVAVVQAAQRLVAARQAHLRAWERYHGREVAWALVDARSDDLLAAWEALEKAIGGETNV